MRCGSRYRSKMAFSNMFRSERLIYRAIEDNDEDLEFLHSISLDAEGFANSNTLALVPPNKEATKRWKQHLGTCILAVIICLPAGDNKDETSATVQPAKQAGLTPIGQISLCGSSDMRTAHHRNAHIGIDILPAYQRRGYGGEAIEWAAEWGFQTHGLHRISIESFSHNEGAGRLYERLGFVPEQCKREAVWFRGGWSDLLGFAILEDEWRARQGTRQGRAG